MPLHIFNKGLFTIAFSVKIYIMLKTEKYENSLDDIKLKNNIN